MDTQVKIDVALSWAIELDRSELSRKCEMKRLVHGCVKQLKDINAVMELINKDVEEVLAKDGDKVTDVECDFIDCVNGDFVNGDSDDEAIISTCKVDQTDFKQKQK
ncbi:hypothetical protein CHS0354_021835 [Potamilus streckersoni]|uniref:Uncharacterized protein n=1 Tax=Potamilus streckersoni TaxID=2493646 RepID=A0AAE0RQV4_9BIVA|nr:hypothetical protein CHS0354_021835 [Potamilus streckersoni]